MVKWMCGLRFAMRYPGWLIDLLALIFVVGGSVPPVLFGVGTGLDASWLWYDGYAFSHHLHWGQDVLWTYGPLGFLVLPYQYEHWSSWLAAEVAALLARFLWLFVLYVTVREVREKSRGFIELVPLMLSILYLEFEAIHLDVVTVSIAILLLLRRPFLQTRRHHCWSCEAILAGSLMALSGLIKFTSLMIAFPTVAAIGIMSLFLGSRRERSYAAMLLGAFVAAYLLGWLAAGQSLPHLISYARSSFALTSGYSPAMSVESQSRFLWIALALIVTYCVALLSISVRQGLRPSLWTVASTAFALFAAWKEGFVRADAGHTSIFYLFVSAMFLALGAVVLSARLSRSLWSVSAIVIVGYLVHSGLVTALQQPSQVWRRLTLAERLVAAPSLYTRWMEQARLRIRNDYPLPQGMAGAIRDHAVMSLPWDMLLPYAHDASLNAPPVPQLYSAYTAGLDRTDASWVASQGPSYTLLSLKSIDNRYPLFSAPRTYLQVFRWYCLLKASKKYALLKRLKHPHSARRVLVDDGWAAWDKKYVLPMRPRGASVLMGADIHLSIWGHLVGLLYKPSPMYVTLYLRNGQREGPFRYIFRVGDQALLVSPFMQSMRELSVWLRGKGQTLSVAAVRFSVKHDRWEYDGKIGLRFTYLADTRRECLQNEPVGNGSSLDGHRKKVSGNE